MQSGAFANLQHTQPFTKLTPGCCFAFLNEIPLTNSATVFRIRVLLCLTGGEGPGAVRDGDASRASRPVHSTIAGGNRSDHRADVQRLNHGEIS